MGTLALSWVSMWNGHPILTPDAGSYIVRAFSLHPGGHQSIWYSLWIKLTAPEGWLWGTVLAQNLLLTFSLALLAFCFDIAPRQFAIGFGAIALFSPLPWYSNQIMADSLTASLLIALFVFLRAQSKGSIAAAFLILALTLSVHFSHWLLVGALGVLYFKSSKARVTALLVLLVVLWGTTRAINHERFGYPGVHQGANVFLMGRLFESGVLKRYLNRHCPDTSLTLCSATGPREGTINSFMWDRSSIHYQVADASRGQEYRRVILGSLREFPLPIIGFVITSFARQLSRFGTGDAAGRQGEEGPLLGQLQTYSRGQVADFQNSRQQSDRIDYTVWNLVHYWALAMSLTVLFILRRDLSGPAEQWLRFLFLALISNAMICATIAGPFYRYQGRVIGLIVATAVLLASARFEVIFSVKRYCDRLFSSRQRWPQPDQPARPRDFLQDRSHDSASY